MVQILLPGVTPGKGGQNFEGTPIYDNMAEAVKSTGAKIYGNIRSCTVFSYCSKGSFG